MNTNELNEYTSVVSDTTFRLTANKLLIRCGIRADLKGYDCLTDAVILYGTGLCTRFCEIYRIIAANRNIKPKSVMREISYAINGTHGIHEKISALIGIDIPNTVVHNGLVIAYLGVIFRDPDAQIYR